MPSSIDPNIPLSVNPPGGMLSGNPLATLGQFAGFQNAMNQNRLFQQTFAAKQKAGQLLAGAPDLESGIKAMYSDPDVAPFAPEIVSNIRQGMLAQTQRGGELQKQGTDALTGFLKAAPGAVNNPQAFDQYANAFLQSVNPEVQPHVKAAIASIRSSLTDGLPSDPLAAHTELQKRFAGLATAGGVAPDVFGLAAGKPTQVDTGGGIQFGLTSPTSGAFTPAGTVGKTLAPQITQVYGPGGSQQPTIVGGQAASGPGHALLPGAGGGGGVGVPLGMPSPTQTQAKYSEGRGVDMADYQKSLDTNVKAGGQLLQNVQTARDALGQFHAGGGASVYTQLGQVAQAFGASDKLVDRISNGDLSASQEFNKLMVNNVLNQMKTQLPEGNKGAVREFEALKSNNPNIDTDPRAIEKIFNFWTRQYNMMSTEQRELNGYLGQGGDISKWPAQWQTRAKELGFFSDKESTPLASGVTHTWVPGKGLQAVPGGTP